MTDAGSPLPPPTGRLVNAPDQTTPWWKHWWVIAVPIVALLVVIGVVVASTGDGGEDGAEEDGAEATIVDATTEAPPDTEEPATTEPPDATSPPDDAEPTCSYVATDNFGDMQVELVLTNPLGAVPALDVTFALTGGDGVRLLTDSELVPYPLPEERFRLEADTFTRLPSGVDEAAISCAVLAIEEGFGNATELPGSGDVCEFVDVDRVGDIQIELTVTSPFTTTENIFVYYALRGPADVRFSDSLASIDLVGAGETLRVSEDTFTDPPSWVGDEITCDILGFEAI